MLLGFAYLIEVPNLLLEHLYSNDRPQYNVLMHLCLKDDGMWCLPLMHVGLYDIAETPNSRCLFCKTPGSIRHLFATTMQPMHSSPISCCGQLIVSRANKQQGNSADCNKEIALRYACSVNKPCPLAI